MWAKRCQMLGPAPSARGDPSIWYAEVAAPQILFGHSFGGLVVLRYLETAPERLAGAVVTSPWLATAARAPAWKLFLAKQLAGPLPGLGMSTGLDTASLSTDPAVGQAARSDPLYHSRMTPAAWTGMRSPGL